MAGTAGSFGGAGCAAAGGRAALATVGEPFSAGASASPLGALAGSSGLTALPAIFPAVLSLLSRLAALGMIAFALALPGEADASSAADATAVSAFSGGFGALLSGSAPLFAAGWVSELAGALGVIEAILSFSPRTYPNAVLA